MPNNPFEDIRKEDQDGNEFWTARDLAATLGYRNYNQFVKILKNAIDGCLNNGRSADEHFQRQFRGQKYENYRLSRYACYLIVYCADHRKPAVARGQDYFAIQARLGETVGMDEVSPDDRRLENRRELRQRNTKLNKVAGWAGQLKPGEYAEFYDNGYKGLYGGMTAADIARHKELDAGENISDWMDEHELAANIFRASIATQKLEKENPGNSEGANQIHYQAGATVRGVLATEGLPLPEDRPKPKFSISQLFQRKKQKLLRGGQMEMFSEDES